MVARLLDCWTKGYALEVHAGDDTPVAIFVNRIVCIGGADAKDKETHPGSEAIIWTAHASIYVKETYEEIMYALGDNDVEEDEEVPEVG